MFIVAYNSLKGSDMLSVNWNVKNQNVDQSLTENQLKQKRIFNVTHRQTFEIYSDVRKNCNDLKCYALIDVTNTQTV